MQEVMLAVLAAALFAAATEWDAAGLMGIGLVTLLVLALASASGLRIAHDAPKTASRLVGAWDVAVLLAAAALAAAAAYAAADIAISTPKDANASAKTTAGLSAAVVGALAGRLASPLDSFGSSWLARSSWIQRYTKLFPALPSSPPEGVQAYRALSGLVATDRAELGHGGRVMFLEAAQTAVDAGAFAGGDNWQAAEPPREREQR